MLPCPSTAGQQVLRSLVLCSSEPQFLFLLVLASLSPVQAQPVSPGACIGTGMGNTKSKGAPGPSESPMGVSPLSFPLTWATAPEGPSDHHSEQAPQSLAKICIQGSAKLQGHPRSPGPDFQRESAGAKPLEAGRWSQDRQEPCEGVRVRGDQQCPQNASFWPALTLFPTLVSPAIGPLVYPQSCNPLSGPSLTLPPKAGPRCHGREAGSSCPSARGHHHQPSSSLHPSPLITTCIHLDTHFVYFHNVVNCPESTENISPCFRVSVTQFIAIYSTKADSNSTGERRRKRFPAPGIRMVMRGRGGCQPPDWSGTCERNSMPF